MKINILGNDQRSSFGSHASKPKPTTHGNKDCSYNESQLQAGKEDSSKARSTGILEQLINTNKTRELTDSDFLAVVDRCNSGDRPTGCDADTDLLRGELNSCRRTPDKQEDWRQHHSLTILNNQRSHRELNTPLPQPSSLIPQLEPPVAISQQFLTADRSQINIIKF